VRYENRGETIAGQRDHKFASLVSGFVCAKCNNGWLAELEGLAKSHLVPLFDGSFAGIIDQAASEIIATWMFKTALTLDSASQSQQKRVPPDHYGSLFQNRTVPSNVATAVAYLQNDDVNWIEGASRPVKPNGLSMDRLNEYIRSAYQISLGIGHLAWRVNYWPPWPQEYGPGFGFYDHYDASIRYIWLDGPKQITWPPPDTIDSVKQLHESQWLRGEPFA
jgi:hypothetical protein